MLKLRANEHSQPDFIKTVQLGNRLMAIWEIYDSSRRLVTSINNFQTSVNRKVIIP